MAVRLLGDTYGLERGFANLCEVYPYAIKWLNEEITVSQLAGNSEYDLEIYRHEGELCVSYRRQCDFFRALGHIASNVVSEKIQEHARYEKGGVMLDVSRDAVYTIKQLKEFLAWQALCGLNTCYLYMEDTYELKGYPYFGYLRGRYTQAELMELDAFADSLGIELIPCIQTLAHLTTTLKWDYAAVMRDTPNTLLVGQEETYKFVHEMLSQLRKVFRTNRIHIGMDEAMDLGTGVYLRKNGAANQYDLMMQHLTRVTQMAQDMGWLPIIWDDMFYRSKNQNLEYYDPATVLTAEDIAKVPQNVQLVYWDYYHNTQAEYECLLEKRKDLPNDIIFAGGIWKWNGWVPNYGKTFTATREAMAACRNHRVHEIIATMWGDNGGEAVLNTVWPGLILFGQAIYDAPEDDATIDSRCKGLTGLSLSGFLAVEELDLLPWCERPNLKTRNPSKYFLYQDILLGAFDKYVISGVGEHYARWSSELKRLAEGGEYAPRIREMLELYAQLARVLSVKTELGVTIRKAYKAGDKAALEAILPVLEDLEQQVCTLQALFAAVWVKSARGTGLEVHDIRLGGLSGRVRTIRFRLASYVQGDINRLDELDQELLPFMQAGLGDEQYPLCNKYLLIASQNLF
jgi:hypothetical protein